MSKNTYIFSFSYNHGTVNLIVFHCSVNPQVMTIAKDRILGHPITWFIVLYVYIFRFFTMIAENLDPKEAVT